MKTKTLLTLIGFGTSLGGCAITSEPVYGVSADSGGVFAEEPARRSNGAMPAAKAEDLDGSAPNEGDRFEDVGTNPFVMAAHDPRSTFAADVDTASYDIFRRDIGLGNLPRAESVRLEEFVNYFPYAYPAPAHDSTEPFAIYVDAAPSPIAEERTVVSVGIKGKQPPPEEKRQANLVFLVDVSGSMNSGLKLDLVKTVLTETLEILDPTDRVSIVTYAGNVGIRLPSTPVADKDEIVAVLDSLRSGGSTAGAGGMHLAYQQAEDNYIEGGINHVILCTDGDFNVGVSHDEGLVGLITEKRKSGVTFTALGFGVGNLNDSMLEAISNAGDGVYGVITSEDHAIEYVHDRMLSNINFIAKDVKIQVWFNPEHVLAYRLLGYENRDIADDDFRNDVVDAGEIGAGHTVTALYEVILPGQAVPTASDGPEAEDGDAFDGEIEMGPDELVRVMIRYKDVDATEDDAAHEVQTVLLPGDIGDDIAAGSDDFRWAVGIAAFAEILKGSPFVDPDSLGVLAALFEANQGNDAQRLEFGTLFDRARELLEARPAD